MKIHSKIQGDYIVKENCKLHGLVTGSVTVEENVSLDIHGMVCKNVLVMQGAILHSHGTVGGKILNQGGLVEIWGVVEKDIDNMSGSVVIHKDAIVNKRRFEQDETVN